MRNAVVDFYPRHRGAKINKPGPCFLPAGAPNLEEKTTVNCRRCKKKAQGFPNWGRDMGPEIWHDFRWCTSFNSNIIPCIFCRRKNTGAPKWLSQLSGWLRLRSWSWSSRVRASRGALCWQLGAWSLFQILCLPLFLLPHLHSCFTPLSLSLKSK